eukprot:COSAG05_NODE_7128_length_852_cov_5.928287_1_plen_61_part_10
MDRDDVPRAARSGAAPIAGLTSLNELFPGLGEIKLGNSAAAPPRSTLVCDSESKCNTLLFG